MENNVTTIGQDINRDKLTKKIIGHGTVGQNGWFKTKAMPWLKNVFAKMGGFIGSITINSRDILVLVVLAYLANAGFLDEMPNVKWLIECGVRLVDWLCGLLRTVAAWAVGAIDSNIFTTFDIFGIFELFSNWFKGIMGL